MKLISEVEPGDNEQHVTFKDLSNLANEAETNPKIHRENRVPPARVTMTQNDETLIQTQPSEKSLEAKPTKEEPKEGNDMSDLISKLTSCKVEEKNESDDVTEALDKLTLKEEKVAQLEVKHERPDVEAVESQKEEADYDRTQDDTNDAAEQKETETEEASSSLVTLEAPASDDEDESGTGKEKTSKIGQEKKRSGLNKKGPNGIPVQHVGMIGNMGQLNMPNNFPNYSQYPNNFNPVDGSKRVHDDVEECFEKFRKPQTAPQMNDLNKPSMTNPNVTYSSFHLTSGGIVYPPPSSQHLPQQQQQPGNIYNNQLTQERLIVDHFCDNWQTTDIPRGDNIQDDASDGYESDTRSPGFSSQCSIASASPRSQVQGSPPQGGFSRPHSNQSFDSGVNSPMSDDFNNAQVTSPPLFNGMQAGYMSPPHQTNFMGQMQPNRASLPTVVEPASNFVPPSIARSDQTTPSPRKDADQFFKEHILDLSLALSVASEDLKQMQEISTRNGKMPPHSSNIKNTDSQVCPGQNIPADQVPINVAQNILNVGQYSMNVEKKPNSPSGIAVKQHEQNETSSLVVSLNSVQQVKNPVSPPGKIAIPQAPKKNPNQAHGVPVFLLNVVHTPQTVKPSPTRYRKIVPRVPDKRMPEESDGTVKSGSNPGLVSSPKAVQNGCEQKNQGSPGCDGKTRPPSYCLNIARRCVAELETTKLNYVDPDGDTYLHDAILKTDEFLVQAILERLRRNENTKMINAQNTWSQTPVYLAVSEKKPEMVKLLVKEGADVNLLADSHHANGDVQRMGCIHRASSEGEGHLTTLQALLTSSSITVDLENFEGHTALHCAIRNHGKQTDNKIVNSIPIIKTLLAAGANPNLQIRTSGKTALMYILESRNLDLVESVFQHIRPEQLQVCLKIEAYDSSTCQKIADQWKMILDPAGKQRLNSYISPKSSRRR